MEAEHYMQRCLSLAKLGLGKVKTNPMVGCVVVKNNRIIGEGYHQAFGEAHAEVNALKGLSNHELIGAEVYVSLEPCSHQGKTPPCANLLLQKGVSKVHVAMTDPNPVVSGNGIQLLRNNGVEVTVGLLEKEAKQLNHVFIHGIKHKQPYITLKWAQSSDGFMAGNQGGEKITNEQSDINSHAFRDGIDAIVVGRITAEIDKPQLNARLYSDKQLLKILFSKKELNGYFNLRPDYILADLETLYSNHHIGHLMVEGGSKTLSFFLENNLYNSIRVITANNLTLETGTKAPETTIPFSQEISMSNNKLQLFHK